MISWMTSLFASNQPTQLLPLHVQESTISYDQDEYGERKEITRRKGRRKERHETTEGEQEEARPPYLHVRKY